MLRKRKLRVVILLRRGTSEQATFEDQSFAYIKDEQNREVARVSLEAR